MVLAVRMSMILKKYDAGIDELLKDDLDESEPHVHINDIKKVNSNMQIHDKVAEDLHGILLPRSLTV